MCENNAHFVFFIKRRVSFFKLCTFRFAVIRCDASYIYNKVYIRAQSRPFVHGRRKNGD